MELISHVEVGRNVFGDLVFDGLIDDVRIYNRALTSQEVLALFNTLTVIDEVQNVAEIIVTIDLGLFVGNENASAGRRNALANRLSDAAADIAAGDIDGAIDHLESALNKIDGQSPPPDWMEDSPEKTSLAEDINRLIGLLSM